MRVLLHCVVCGKEYRRYPSKAGSCCSRRCVAVLANAGRQRWIEATSTRRFWDRVLKTDRCWLWIASVDSFGYGKLKWGKETLAHRVAWTLTHGSPGDACVLHHCDNPPCVRPEHLFLGDRQANSDDMRAKGRDRHNAGEECVRRVLTRDEVERIRALEGHYTQVTLGAMFGIRQPHVSRIQRGVAWIR